MAISAIYVFLVCCDFLRSEELRAANVIADAVTGVDCLVLERQSVDEFSLRLFVHVSYVMLTTYRGTTPADSIRMRALPTVLPAIECV